MVLYNRYSKINKNGKIGIVPFVEISRRDTDYFEAYDRKQNRLDLMSFNYYNDSGFGWLIMQANPEYGSLEQEIPNGTVLRIPYPLNDVLMEYEEKIQ